MYVWRGEGWFAWSYVIVPFCNSPHPHPHPHPHPLQRYCRRCVMRLMRCIGVIPRRRVLIALVMVLTAIGVVSWYFVYLLWVSVFTWKFLVYMCMCITSLYLSLLSHTRTHTHVHTHTHTHVHTHTHTDTDDMLLIWTVHTIIRTLFTSSTWLSSSVRICA